MKARMNSFLPLWFVALLVGVLWSSPALTAPIEVGADPIKVAILPSAGTQSPGITIWDDLNAGWSGYGDIPVEIDNLDSIDLGRAYLATFLTPKGMYNFLQFHQ